MFSKSLAFTALVSILIAASLFFPENIASILGISKQPTTVPYVDVQSYLGTWYEQSTIPYFFQRGCSKTIANYSLNKDNTIHVVNTCYRNGKLQKAVGKATPQDSTNAKLKVQFIETLNIGAPYWIVRLAKDYSYSVVSSSNYNYLWILYREPVMPESLYNEIYADLKKDGYHVEKLVKTQQ